MGVIFAKIFDKGDEIVSLGSNLEEEVALMLKMVKGKGWNLETMEINGNKEFKQEANRQINELLVKNDSDIKEDTQQQKRPSRRGKRG